MQENNFCTKAILYQRNATAAKSSNIPINFNCHDGAKPKKTNCQTCTGKFLPNIPHFVSPSYQVPCFSAVANFCQPPFCFNVHGVKTFKTWLTDFLCFFDPVDLLFHVSVFRSQHYKVPASYSKKFSFLSLRRGYGVQSQE